MVNTTFAPSEMSILNDTLFSHIQHDSVLNEVCDTDNDDQYFIAATQLMQLGTLPIALKAAVELNMFVIMAKAGNERLLSPKEIAAKLPAASSQSPEVADMIDRVLRLLASHSVVRCTVDVAGDGNVGRKYGLGPISKLFVPDENGVSLGPFMSLAEDSVVRASRSQFNESVLGEIPFEKVHGVPAFEYTDIDKRFNQVFNAAMFNYTTIFVNKMLQRYKGFKGIDCLVDVGGGLGHSIHAITSMYPSIKGINYDLPHVISHAQSYLGVEHVGGNMFESVPKGDAIFLKWILHDWNDEQCVTLLKNCYKALPENGKMIVVESILTEEPGTTSIAKAVSQMDVSMMDQIAGAKERTVKEYQNLANDAGFAGIKLVCRVCHFWVMEFHK